MEGIVLGELAEGAEDACRCGGAGLLGTRVDVHNSAD